MNITTSEVAVIIGVGLPDYSRNIITSAEAVSSSNPVPVGYQTRKLFVVNEGNYRTYLGTTVCRTKTGDILCFARVGQTHGAVGDEGKIVLYRSSDNGLTWGGEEVVSAYAGEDRRNPLCILASDGSIILAHAVISASAYPSVIKEGLVLRSIDDGHTWKQISTIPTTYYLSSSGNIRYSPLGNDFILPCFKNSVPREASFLVATYGFNFTVRSTIAVAGHNLAEPSIVWGEDDILYAAIRDGEERCYRIAKSTDRGVTWDSVVLYPDLRGTNPTLGIINNRLVLASREVYSKSSDTGNQGLGIYSSRDGVIWYGKKLLLAPTAGNHITPEYGCFIEVSPGVLYYFFTMEQWATTLGQTIWPTRGVYYIVITEDDLAIRDKSYPATILDLATLAAGFTSTLANCIGVELRDCQRLTITVEATYHALATQGIKVHVRTSADGIVYDTEDWDSWTPTGFVAGATIRQTENYDANPRYVKVLVENLDLVRAVTNIKVNIILGA